MSSTIRRLKEGSTVQKTGPSPRKNRLLHIGWATVIFMAAAAVGLVATRATWGISCIWPANGLVVGLFYRGKNTHWIDLSIAILIGGLLSNLLLLSDSISGIIYSVGNIVEILGVRLALRGRTLPGHVPHPRGLFRFLFFAALLPASAAGMVVGALSHAALAWPFGNITISWLYSDTLGLAVFFPVGLLARAAFRAFRKSFPSRPAVSVAIVSNMGKALGRQCAVGVAAHGLMLLVSILVFTHPHRLPSFWALPPLILGVLWAGSYAAVTGTFLISALAVIITMRDPTGSAFGKFSEPAQAILQVQGFMLACMLTVYLMAAILQDRQRYLRHATRGHSMQLRLADKLRMANDELNALAYRDPLTGLANRRAFDDALNEAIQTHAEEHAKIGVMFIDVDWFKAYNDAYGHQRGDETLRLVASALYAALPYQSVVARIGGEEFAIVCPHTDETALAQFAQETVARVANLHTPHTSSAHGRVTVSVGITVQPCSKATLAKDLLLMADKAMYQAKLNGRNGYAVAPGQ